MKKQGLARRGNNSGLFSFVSALAAIVIGIAVGFVILLFANPPQAARGLMVILQGGFTSLRDFGSVLYNATPIIMTGLSVGFAQKCGLFNIGGPGQFIVGGFVAIYIGVKWTFLPGATHWMVALLGAALAGALWGLVPGIMKALANVNEVIACIMMNYIGMSFVNMMVRRTVYDAGRNQSILPEGTGVLPKAGFDQIFVSGGAASSANAGFIIAVLLGIVMWVVIGRTKFGFELKACGLNRDAAKYAGINEKKSIVLSMVIAGALCGVGGALLFLGGAGRAIHVVDTLANEGFNGIPVALLGMSNPIAIIFSGLFISHLTMGSFNMQLIGIMPEVVDVITAVIIYFSAFALFFQQVMQGIARRRAGALRARNGPEGAPRPPAQPPDEPAPGAAGGEGGEAQ